eukprot:3411458-Amphidinium_carterae.1
MIVSSISFRYLGLPRVWGAFLTAGDSQEVAGLVRFVLRPLAASMRMVGSTTPEVPHRYRFGASALDVALGTDFVGLSSIKSQ